MIATDKILIVDPSETQCHSIANVLSGKYHLQVCHDGITAQKLIKEFAPAAIIMELQLQGIDGLSLLESMTPGSRPVVLIYTNCRSDYVMHKTQMLADYTIFKPGNVDIIADRITDILNVRNEIDPIMTANDPIDAFLRRIIHRPWRDGYQYLLAAVEEFAADPRQSMTKELYPNVGKRFGASGGAIEKGIRDAIEQAWKERDNAVWRELFPSDINGNVYRPTNKAFFSIVVHHFKDTVVYQKRA